LGDKNKELGGQNLPFSRDVYISKMLQNSPASIFNYKIFMHASNMAAETAVSN